MRGDHNNKSLIASVFVYFLLGSGNGRNFSNVKTSEHGY